MVLARVVAALRAASLASLASLASCATVVHEHRIARIAPGAPVDMPLAPLARSSPAPSPDSSVATVPGVAARVTSLPESAQAAIDKAVADALALGKLPGCVVAIGRHDGLLFTRAYGSRWVTPSVVPMTVDTVFDLASLTKPLATASSIMVLAQRGLVDLDAPLRKYLPELGDRGDATLRQALTHTAGFLADTPLSEYEHGLPDVLAGVARRPLKYAPGTDARYSDVGFILLGEIVHRVSGQGLEAFAHDAVFAPLGMTETGFLPGPALHDRIAPTENVDNRWLVGEVHDPRSRRLGGVAGHAGLFSTVADLATFARAMLGQGRSFLSPSFQAAYLAPHDVPRGIRALGWDVKSAFSTNRGTLLSPRAFGHGGYTGTSLWVDRENDLFIVFLSNRVHPTGHGEVNPLAGAIADIAARALGLGEGSVAAPGHAKTGLDVLAASNAARLSGRHVGLITNAAGVTSDGRRDIDVLAHAPGVSAVSLVALFAPEHGLATDKDAVIADGKDPATGLPVYSLYGKHLAPTDEELAGIDTLVVDLPDVGVRFFTYASTLHRVLAVAAKRGLRVMVLDRPDPQGGLRVEGPLPTGARSFVNHAELPVRHGMTMGELALMLDAVDHLGTDLEIVKAEGWTRGETWDRTGLPWIAPSPNLKTVDEARLYPGVALLEATNVSVGRGTETPFEVVGAPWIDGPKLAAALEQLHVVGVKVEATSFTPESSAHRGKECHGVRIALTADAAFSPVTLGIALAVALERLYPTTWESKKLRPLLQSAKAVALIQGGASVGEVVASFQADDERFMAQREKYVLYPVPR